MESIDLDGWRDFATATAGAAGALAGLIIVAVSVNVKEIIAGQALPARAGATIAAVMVIVVASVVMLVPDQSALALGLEIVGFSVVALLLQVDSIWRTFTFGQGAGVPQKVGQAVFGIGQLIPVLIGGIIVATGSVAGLNWVAAGVVAIFIVSVLNAWVLMVEILR